MSLYHQDDLRWFLNTDETHHTFSTASKKGGSTTQSYANNSFPFSGEPVIKNSRHTTGVYTTNAAGEVLPPLYIFDSKAQDEKNYKIDLRACDGLPTVTGKYGLDKVQTFHSFVAVRKKGSMDTSLWKAFNKDIILPCYPNIANKVVRCPITKKILKGPVIMKTDAGPGRLSKTLESIDFREEMHKIGYVFLLVLPNATAATQEMDQGYGALKRECDKSTVRIASMKMADRVRARKKVKDAPTILDLQQFLAEELDDGDDDDAFTLTHGKSVCNVTIGNPDLPRIVNGFPGDPIQKRPFDFVFTKENIWGWWKKVGFMPMSRNSLNHPKV